MSPLSPDSALPLPRILCLHGGGTSAAVFQMQCRSIIRHLATTFRLVFVDAPFSSRPHAAIVPFFGEAGPFYRWLRWHDDEPEDDDASTKILDCLAAAMRHDEGTGPWVGVLGFSQGAKVAASLLWAQENVPGVEPTFKFGVVMAGRAPVVVLDPQHRFLGKGKPAPRHMATVNETSADFGDWPGNNEGDHAIMTPTLHVHGLQDPGLDLHRGLLREYCRAGTTRLVEWEGDHRLPIKTDDVDRIIAQLVDMAKQVGAIS